ncbi:hypothetical protein HRG_001144 [Hirsutella rhossiliensis]|uniref:Gas1-like protein n=1 Tax=Hirsutella rhossiliensis TaxID=111463 RepID=A0A9P8NC92_9HYPO|nr:putative gas1-like protein [Hirsutella rhossiliensis]KAH0968502.1 putative gas1-like protein [Hirsutella rhossiliensis]
MAFSSVIVVAPLMFTLARCHGVIVNAQGEKGSPPSVGFQVDPSIARNCITISPCQQDTTIIRDQEIKTNVVNQCGRTQLTGNIDVGENTENALAAGQVNADGAGPYTCDMDQSGNTGIEFTNLTVSNNVPGTNGFSQAKAEAFDINVQMPDNFKCEGGSTGNICTIRCRNNALAGPFGGCFAVQQTDTKGGNNSPAQISTANKLEDVLDQVQQDQADFGTAVKANEVAGSDEAEQNRAAVESILANKVVTKEFPQETPDVSNNNNNDNNDNSNNNNNNNNNNNKNNNNNNINKGQGGGGGGGGGGSPGQGGVRGGGGGRDQGGNGGGQANAQKNQQKNQGKNQKKNQKKSQKKNQKKNQKNQQRRQRERREW